MQSNARDKTYDVLIIGGALSGAATAILLLQQDPRLRVIIVEKSACFDRKVGEATVEVSAFFLRRALGLSAHLNDKQLTKQGLRFWFSQRTTDPFDQCSEIGGKYLARIPSYQLDRSILDETALARAVALGAELWRPAQVRDVALRSGSTQRVEVDFQGSKRSIEARWVVDASGLAAMLARRNGWLQMNTEHPTAALWARFSGVKDWDSPELTTRYADWANACHGLRNTATNHVMGPGWWAWCIPLKGGDVSIGAVFDQRFVQLPNEGTLAQRLKTFLVHHPIARELLEHADVIEGDVHWRKNLAYRVTVQAGDGFILVGDAAGFIDPFYSPGMDWIAYTTTAASELILKERAGEPAAELAMKHNALFTQSYDRWFRALYLNKYEYIGEFDLMRVAFLMDIALYYLGVVTRPLTDGPKALAEPVFHQPGARFVYRFMCFYNRRLATIGRSRRERGTLGMTNMGHRYLVPGFSLSRATSLVCLKAFRLWMLLELQEGWRTWFDAPKPSALSHEPAKDAHCKAPEELETVAAR